MTADGKRIGLAFSGGGYRAASYHIGVLRTLHKLGILDKVDVISSVSGGSITSAYYALHQQDYNAFETGLIEKLQHGVLRNTITSAALLLLLLSFVCIALPLLIGAWSILGIISILLILYRWQFVLFPSSKYIEKKYNKLFFDGIVLSEIPETPQLAINATDIATGTLFTFSQKKSTCYAYEYDNDKPTNFKCNQFPLARAVMASSCVPHFFSPIQIGEEFQTLNKRDDILLVDGGLYDNQGAHKLVQSKSSYKTDYCIVSDAGNNELSAKGALNSVNMILKTVDIMMKRIRTFQSSQNMYSQLYKNSRFAYISLRWKYEADHLNRFVYNIKKGKIYQDVIDAHGITTEEVERLRNEDLEISQQAFHDIVSKVSANIGWEQLSKSHPSDETHSLAKSVGTNLIALSQKKIDALIAHSEWLSEVQIRTYLPFLVQSN